MTTDILPIRRVLLSVSDKSGVAEFAAALAKGGAQLLSTGGTATTLRKAGLTVEDVADYTGFPEMMDGRVKTLHPKIHGGLLALRDNPAHVQAMEAHGIAPIDMVVINLYPFEATVARGAAPEEIIENIDIGGPSMVRSAAKNHRFVACVTSAADYPALLAEIADKGGLTLATRRRLAADAFARTAAYDTAIAGWFAGHEAGSGFPATFTLSGTRAATMRYGENPHQKAALYSTGTIPSGFAAAELVQGKPLSFNNIRDADGAFGLIAEFRDAGPTVAIIKHANPCGVATSDSLVDAHHRALACDPVSAFGGIVALNRPLDAATAEEIARIFTEVVIAPDADADARAILAKKKNLRLMLAPIPDPAAAGLSVRTVAGGFLVQSADNALFAEEKLVTKRAPTAEELADLRFAWAVAKHVKSNAIVYAKGGATAGIGAGQMSRLDSAEIAASKARKAAEAAGLAEPLTTGSVVASDAFFPFADGLIAAADAGATAVIQPGGSIRDDEVIAAANERGLAMIFTGMRHFNH